MKSLPAPFAFLIASALLWAFTALPSSAAASAKSASVAVDPQASASTVAEARQRQDASGLIKTFVDGYKPEDFIDLKLGKPALKDGTVSVPVHLTLNMEKYRQVVLGDLVKLLEQVAIEKSERSFKPEVSEGNNLSGKLTSFLNPVDEIIYHLDGQSDPIKCYDTGNKFRNILRNAYKEDFRQAEPDFFSGAVTINDAEYLLFKLDKSRGELILEGLRAKSAEKRYASITLQAYAGERLLATKSAKFAISAVHGSEGRIIIFLPRIGRLPGYHSSESCFFVKELVINLPFDTADNSLTEMTEIKASITFNPK
jgi:hypothetical protein